LFNKEFTPRGFQETIYPRRLFSLLLNSLHDGLPEMERLEADKGQILRWATPQFPEYLRKQTQSGRRP
jgi:hypothetical protein